MALIAGFAGVCYLMSLRSEDFLNSLRTAQDRAFASGRESRCFESSRAREARPKKD